MASARFVVCEDAAVPAATAAAAEQLRVELDQRCPHEHTVRALNLRPLDRRIAGAHWLRHAWGHGPVGEDRMVSLLPHPILVDSPLQVEVKRALGL